MKFFAIPATLFLSIAVSHASSPSPTTLQTTPATTAKIVTYYSPITTLPPVELQYIPVEHLELRQAAAGAAAAQPAAGQPAAAQPAAAQPVAGAAPAAGVGGAGAVPAAAQPGRWFFYYLVPLPTFWGDADFSIMNSICQPRPSLARYYRQCF